jgi:hypothetical protein
MLWQSKNMKIAYAKAKYSVKDSKIIARELKAIQKEQSVITPKAVVIAAENPKSPLNKYFEWNDSAAAERYREWQARQLIASVFIVDSDNENSQPVRAFVAIQPEDDNDDFIADRGYVSTPSIAGKQNYESQVLEYAKQQLKGWRKRFGNFQEFFEVVEAIDSL